MQPTINFGLRILRQAGEELVKHLDELQNINTKTKISETLAKDIGALIEQRIHKSIRYAHPEHSINGQFIPSEAPDISDNHPSGERNKQHVWDIELWDNSDFVMTRHPASMMRLSHSINGKLQNIIMLNPFTKEELYSTLGQGTQLNGRRVRCSPERSLDNALIGVDWVNPENLTSNQEWTSRWIKLSNNAKYLINSGSSITTLTQAICGQLHGAILSNIPSNQWDTAKLLIQESGALVCNLKGEPQVKAGDTIIIANPKLLRSLLATTA